MIAANRRVFETGEEAVATWSSWNMRLLSSKSPSHFAIEVVYPCGMEGWIGGRSLSFCDVCREILGSTAANGAT
jgi:formylmethanofuran dehydrogenase subunit A